MIPEPWSRIIDNENKIEYNTNDDYIIDIPNHIGIDNSAENIPIKINTVTSKLIRSTVKTVNQ